MTDEQILTAIREAGSKRGAARLLGIEWSGSFARRCKGLSEAKRGTVRRKSTLRDAKGNVRAEWEIVEFDRQQVEETNREIRAALNQDLPVFPKRKEVRGTDPDHCTIYDTSDTHTGLLSWGAETGQSWDIDIGLRHYKGVINDIVERAPATETAVSIWAGDIFHSDNIFNSTSSAKTNLDCEGRFPKMIGAAYGLTVYKVDRLLQKHDRVKLIIQGGNHDAILAAAMREAFIHIYRDNPRVEVVSSPNPFVFFTFGSTLIGTTHGHTCKVKDLPGIMSTDVPKLWGNADWRLFYYHHIHHERVTELNGCTVHTKNSLVAKDAWHHASGYRAKQQIDAQVIHKTGGHVQTIYSNAVMAGVA